MELKDFIKTVIEDVFEAIVEEQTKYSPGIKLMSGVVAPQTPIKISTIQHTKREIERISFELEVEEQQEKRADGKIGLSIVRVGTDIGKATAIGNAQKVSFSIPVYYPTIGGTDQQSPHDNRE